MNAWKHTESGEVRLHKPDKTEGWEEVPFESLKPSDRILLTYEADKEERAKLDTEQRERFETLKREVDELWARTPTIGARKADDKPAPISFGKLFRAMKTGDWSKAGYEKEIVTSPEARALAQTTDTAGGFIVPAEYLGNEFVEQIYAVQAVFAAGARRLTGLRGSPVQIPKMTGGATVYWVGENAAGTTSDQAFGLITMQPKKMMAITPVSNELLMMSTPAVEGIVRNDLANAIGAELDNQAINGTGASGKPVGLLNTTGVEDTAASVAITPDTCWDQVFKVEENNIMIGQSAAFIMSHKQWNELRQAGDGAGTPKFDSGAGAALTKQVNGIPVFSDGNCAAGVAIFGLWNELLIGEWGGIMFSTSDSASDGTNYAFTQDQTWIRATMMVDIGVRQPLAFCFNDNYT